MRHPSVTPLTIPTRTSSSRPSRDGEISSYSGRAKGRAQSVFALRAGRGGDGSCIHAYMHAYINTRTNTRTHRLIISSARMNSLHPMQNLRYSLVEGLCFLYNKSNKCRHYLTCNIIPIKWYQNHPIQY